MNYNALTNIYFTNTYSILTSVDTTVISFVTIGLTKKWKGSADIYRRYPVTDGFLVIFDQNQRYE